MRSRGHEKLDRLRSLSLFWVGMESQWDDPSEDASFIAWTRSAMDALTPFAMTAGYVNDQPETSLEGLRAIYGEAKYERLVALKRVWDPDNVFHLNQNIRP